MQRENTGCLGILYIVTLGAFVENSTVFQKKNNRSLCYCNLALRCSREIIRAEGKYWVSWHSSYSDTRCICRKFNNTVQEMVFIWQYKSVCHRVVISLLFTSVQYDAKGATRHRHCAHIRRQNVETAQRIARAELARRAHSSLHVRS